MCGLAAICGGINDRRDKLMTPCYRFQQITDVKGEQIMSKSTIASLESLFRKLNTERQGHLDDIAEIDAAFESLGMTATKPKKRKRRPGRPKKSGKRAKRRKFKTTASELVLATVKRAGKKGATGAQINKAWKAAKRPGDAYNTLGQLTKAKKIKRINLKGERGSRYTVA